MAHAIFIDEIKKVIETRNALAKQVYNQYELIVNDIINSKQTDLNKICYQMDYILDFCFDDKILLLYRKLCRYVFDLDSETAIYYVNAYREFWDEDGEKFGKEKINKTD